MEDTTSADQLTNDDQIPTKNHLRSQVITPTDSIEETPVSESSILGLDHTFTYDIYNSPGSDSLLLEILSRMPLKSIFRFKCVCKHWQTLISHPSFTRFCLSRMLTTNAGSSSSKIRIVYKYIYESEFEDVVDRFRHDSYCLSEFSVPFLPREQQHSFKFKVVAVSNGLILCCSLGPLVYYVCDPVSRQWVTVVGTGRFTDAQRFIGEGFVSRVNEDNVVTSYTVVRVEMIDPPTNYLGLDIFSSDDGKWVHRKVPCANSIALIKRGVGPISFNGILHWFVHDHGMIAFDVYKDPKSCRFVRFPDDIDVQSEYTYDGLYRLCDGCQGKLRFFQVAPDASSFYCFSMWDLRDYEKGEWCSEFKVTRLDLSSSDPVLSSWLTRATFRPLCFHPLDLDIVYLRCVDLACVVSYSIQNRRLDVVCEPTNVIEDLSWRVVVPFAIQRWPTRVPVPSVRKRASKTFPIQKMQVLDPCPTGEFFFYFLLFGVVLNPC